jgi:DNA polymerase III subunit epsilon
MTWLNFLQRAKERHAEGRVEIDSLRYVVVDTELTSLDRKTNRILSIGAIAMDGRKIRIGEQFYRVINPGVAVPEQTILVHGLRPKDVEEGESPEDALQDFLEFAGDAVLVGHFVKIDMDALAKEMRRVGLSWRGSSLDTAAIYRWLELTKKTYYEITDDRIGSVELAAIARKYDVEVFNTHHALDDAFLTARLWQKLLAMLADAGICTLSEVSRLVKRHS